MPRKLPTEHKHEIPGDRGSLIAHDAPFECQNEVVIKDIQRRLRIIEDRPAPLVPKIPDNDAGQVPRAFGDFFQRVLILEKQLSDLQSQQAIIVDDGSEDLAIAVSDLTATAMKMFAMIQSEIELIRRRVNKLDNDQMELVGGLREFAALESRRA